MTHTHTQNEFMGTLVQDSFCSVFGESPVLGNPQQLGEGGASPAETQQWQGAMCGLHDNTPA